ncbi:MAG: DUF2149 domain-containing protein [Nocardioides sp.]|uniref:DUF2149 domain-containing protein n=1 Tax=Nocardioides sp. TaxID=35761 RepID=UPI0039E3118B
MIRVSPRARRHEDNAGDPLDGLVNLFDLGIVLAVAFLLAALTAAHVGIGSSGLTAPKDAVTTQPGDETGPVPTDGASVIGSGEEVGTVYRLTDGRLVYVVPSAGPSAPSASSTP